MNLDDLAAAKRLPAGFLRHPRIGLADVHTGGVAIPYFDETGKKVAVKLRTALRAKDGSRWPRGVKPMLYGLWRLDEARRHGVLWLVEGESCCWSAWLHWLPCLGFPGSSTTSLLEREHLVGIGSLYVVQEPDAGGKAFTAGLVDQLSSLEYTGLVHVLDCGPGVKDLADLHAADPLHFPRRLEARVRVSRRGRVRTPSTAGCSLAGDELVPRLKDQIDGILEGKPRQAEPIVLQPIPWPDPPAEEAFHGLAGDVVRKIDPETEADPVAILAHLLVMFGNCAGRNAYQPIESSRHHTNMFCVFAGKTAKGRKGTALDRVEHLFRGAADDAWSAECISSGLSSGEGLINSVRDKVIKRGPDGEFVADEGVADKRMLVIEEEFASVLSVAGRDNSILTTVLRQAWDGRRLATLNKKSPIKATAAHISLIGHVTRDELLHRLGTTDAANGFLNRFLWFAVKRSKLLPEGGGFIDMRREQGELSEALEFAKKSESTARTPDARKLWREEYPRLSAERPGVLGLVTNRAEAHVMRLSLLYAMLDCSKEIHTVHLRAALALWDYCERSARWIFGDSVGDPEGDILLEALDRAHPEGLTLTEISGVFMRNKSAAQLQRIIAPLVEHGLVIPGSRPAKGKPAGKYRSARKSTNLTNPTKAIDPDGSSDSCISSNSCPREPGEDG